MPKVIIFGSLNVDTVYNVERHPKTGETISALSIVSMPGGKGANQAVAAAKAGAETYLVGAIGTDRDGARYLEHLHNVGVNTDFVRQVDSRTGSAAITVDAHGENSIIIDPGANGRVGEPELEALKRLVGAGDFVSSMNEVPPEAVEQAFASARAAAATSVFNPSPWSTRAQKIAHTVDMVVANEHEAHQLGSQNLNMVMTFGSRGALWDGDFVPAPKVSAVDSTGAGDVFTGTLLASLAQGREQLEALQAAVAAASESCTHQGAQLWTV